MLINLKGLLIKKVKVQDNIKKIELTGFKKQSVRNKVKEIKARRRNYLLLFLLTISSWSALLYIILNTNPIERYSAAMLFTTFFFCVYFTIHSLIFNKKAAMFIAISTDTLLYLRFIGSGNYITTLVVVILTMFLVWLTRRRV